MLLQTNSYIVPKDKRAQHARLVQRFRQTLSRLGCDHFEAYEQVGANWSPADTTGRFVQLMRFRDRKQQLSVQAAERNDATAQALIKEFCELINFPYQQQQGLFAVGFYHSLLPTISNKSANGAADEESPEEEAPDAAALASTPEPGEPTHPEMNHPPEMGRPEMRHPGMDHPGIGHLEMSDLEPTGNDPVDLDTNTLHRAGETEMDDLGEESLLDSEIENGELHEEELAADDTSNGEINLDEQVQVEKRR